MSHQMGHKTVSDVCCICAARRPYVCSLFVMLLHLKMAPFEHPVAHVGFDILAENVRAVHRSAHPGHQSAVGAVAAVARTIKSSFTTSSAKRSNRANADADDDDTPSKRRGGVPSVTPSTRSSTAPRSRRSTLTSSSSTSQSSDATAPVGVGENYFSYSPNEGLVPGHPSVLAVIAAMLISLVRRYFSSSPYSMDAALAA